MWCQFNRDPKGQSLLEGAGRRTCERMLTIDAAVCAVQYSSIQAFPDLCHDEKIPIAKRYFLAQLFLGKRQWAAWVGTSKRRTGHSGIASPRRRQPSTQNASPQHPPLR